MSYGQMALRFKASGSPLLKGITSIDSFGNGAGATLVTAGSLTDQFAQDVLGAVGIPFDSMVNMTRRDSEAPAESIFIRRDLQRPGRLMQVATFNHQSGEMTLLEKPFSIRELGATIRAGLSDASPAETAPAETPRL